MENGDRIKVHERLATLETQVCSIMKNHLPHIQKAVDKLATKFWAVIILLIAKNRYAQIGAACLIAGFILGSLWVGKEQDEMIRQMTMVLTIARGM